MRLANHEVQSIMETADYTLREDDGTGASIVLQVRALPPDYDETTELELPSPRPPRLGVEKENGKVLKDEAGRPIQRYNEEDPDYQRAVTEHNKLQTVKMILDGLVPGQMEFSMAKQEAGEMAQFYRDVLLEMKQFGFSMGDFLGLVRAIADVSNLSDEDIKKAEEVFSEAES